MTTGTIDSPSISCTLPVNRLISSGVVNYGNFNQYIQFSTDIFSVVTAIPWFVIHQLHLKNVQLPCIGKMWIHQKCQVKHNCQSTLQIFLAWARDRLPPNTVKSWHTQHDKSQDETTQCDKSQDKTATKHCEVLASRRHIKHDKSQDRTTQCDKSQDKTTPNNTTDHRIKQTPIKKTSTNKRKLCITISWEKVYVPLKKFLRQQKTKLCDVQFCR